ncbi:MAG: agmatinase [Desulfobacterales bacterium]|jgi:agmatinase
MSLNANEDMPSVKGSDRDSPCFDFPSFMGCPLSQDFLNDDVDVVVSGIPFDIASTMRPGARFGPKAIREASKHLDWEICRWPWDFHVFDVLRVVDCGDLCFDPIAGEQMVTQLQRHAAQILAAEKIMLTLGGDHFITLPLLREHAKRHGSIAVIHFDAHTDTEDNPEPYDHGTMFLHAVNEGLLIPERCVQIGIRSEYDRSNHKFAVLDAAWVLDHKTSDVLNALRRVVGDHPAYVTFDLDCLDPSCAPGTGTPVVGGLSTDVALKIIRGLVGCNLIGMDIVEVSPPYDHAEITSLAAATLGLEFLYVLAANRQETGKY